MAYRALLFGAGMVCGAAAYDRVFPLTPLTITRHMNIRGDTSYAHVLWIPFREGTGIHGAKCAMRRLDAFTRETPPADIIKQQDGVNFVEYKRWPTALHWMFEWVTGANCATVVMTTSVGDGGKLLVHIDRDDIGAMTGVVSVQYPRE